MVSSGEAGKIEKRMVVEYGITLDGVWLPLAMLRRLRAHGPWDAPFTEATADQERVLLLHALGERHNQVGLHRGTGLIGFLDAIPYEPTVPFGKVPAEGKDHDNRGERRLPSPPPSPWKVDMAESTAPPSGCMPCPATFPMAGEPVVARSRSAKERR